MNYRPLFGDHADQQNQETINRVALERAKRDAIAAERLKHERYEQQMNAERQAEITRVHLQAQSCALAQVSQLKAEYGQAESHQAQYVQQSVTAAVGAIEAREQNLINEFPQNRQTVLADGETRHAQVEAILYAEAAQLHASRIQELAQHAEQEHQA